MQQPHLPAASLTAAMRAAGGSMPETVIQETANFVNLENTLWVQAHGPASAQWRQREERLSEVYASLCRVSSPPVHACFEISGNPADALRYIPRKQGYSRQLDTLAARMLNLLLLP